MSIEQSESTGGLTEPVQRAVPQTYGSMGGIARARKHLGEDLVRLHLKLGLAQIVLKLLPYGTLAPLRTRLYRLAGFKHIDKSVTLANTLHLSGDGDIYSRLHVGEHTFINTPCYIELSAPVHIGKRVGIGNHLTIITSTHEVGSAHQRMKRLSYRGVTIGDGVWIGAHVTLLPGVSIGDGAFLTAGAIVTRDVPANAQVAGNHAQIVGWLDPESGVVTKVSKDRSVREPQAP